MDAPTPPVHGLSSAEAARRLAASGPNEVQRPSRVHFLAIAREELTEPMILFEGIPEPIHDRVREALEGAVKRHNPKRDDEEGLKEAVRRTVRRAASDAWGKKPVTRVEAVWV